MKKLIAAVAALFAALAITVTAATPAQALGWSGQRCDNRQAGTGSVSDGYVVCAQMHTVALANGKIWIDVVQVCMGMTKANNHISGSFQNSWNATGGAWGTVPNTDKNGCAYDYPSKAAGSVGAGACYSAGGRINRWLFPDTTWGVSGRVQGGAC